MPTIIYLIFSVVWPATILFALYVALKRKNKGAILPLLIASFLLISVALMSSYEELTTSQLGEMNFLLILVTLIPSFVCSIFGLCALIKNG